MIKQSPKDGGNLIVEAEAYDEFNSCYLIRPYLKKLVGATELLYNQPRYCLWLKDAPDQVLLHPLVKRRLDGVRKMRLASKAADTRKFAEYPHLFKQCTQPDGQPTICIPCVSSERRAYIPMGFLDKDTKGSSSKALSNFAPRELLSITQAKFLCKRLFRVLLKSFLRLLIFVISFPTALFNHLGDFGRTFQKGTSSSIEAPFRA